MKLASLLGLVERGYVTFAKSGRVLGRGIVGVVAVLVGHGAPLPGK